MLLIDSELAIPSTDRKIAKERLAALELIYAEHFQRGAPPQDLEQLRETIDRMGRWVDQLEVEYDTLL